MSNQLLKELASVRPRPKATADELKVASEKFETKFCKAPTSKNWIKHFDQQHCNNANRSYPLIHEKVLQLCERFLDFKRKRGSDIEKSFYKNLRVLDLVERLISKVRRIKAKNYL